MGLWLLAVILASAFLVLAVILHHLGRPAILSIVAVAVGFLAFLPALMRQVWVFRFHERGVVHSGLFGTRELPFDDLDRVRVKVATGASMFKVVFEPISGRGRQKVVLLTRPGDEALGSISAYVPGKMSFV